MNPAYQDLAFAVFTMMAAMVPFDRAIKIAEAQTLVNHNLTDVEAAKLALESKIKEWEFIHK